jgi:hypothetical protein
MAGEEEPIPLTLTLQSLVDRHGMNAILIGMVAVCWAEAARTEEEGKDPRRWQRIASKLDQAWKEA